METPHIGLGKYISMHGPLFFFPRFPLPYLPGIQAQHLGIRMSSPRSLHRLDPEWHGRFKKIMTCSKTIQDQTKKHTKVSPRRQFPGFIIFIETFLFNLRNLLCCFFLQVAVLMAATSSMLQRYQCHVKWRPSWWQDDRYASWSP